jgi:hypothetical protein
MIEAEVYIKALNIHLPRKATAHLMPKRTGLIAIDV